MTSACWLLAAGVFVGLAYIYREVVVKGKSCTSKVKLHGKTVIVTGKYEVCCNAPCVHVCVCCMFTALLDVIACVLTLQ